MLVSELVSNGVIHAKTEMRLTVELAGEGVRVALADDSAAMPRFAGADSRSLLRECIRLARVAGWAPVNVDATVVAEAPKIRPYVAAMKAEIAACLDVAPGAVGVKATTNEGMGFVGRGEGIAALAVATVTPIEVAEEVARALGEGR